MPVDAGLDPANGMVFTLQNQGTNALGLYGDGLGYYGISPATGVAFSLFTGFGVYFQGVGYGPTFYPTHFQSTGNVDLRSTDPISVVISYNNNLLSLSLEDTTTLATYATNFNVNLTNDAGGTTAYVGFTAASGSGYSYQTISNFTFISGAAPFVSPGVTLTAPTNGQTFTAPATFNLSAILTAVKWPGQ